MFQEHCSTKRKQALIMGQKSPFISSSERASSAASLLEPDDEINGNNIC
jgi:hypothetical protein